MRNGLALRSSKHYMSVFLSCRYRIILHKTLGDYMYFCKLQGFKHE